MTAESIYICEHFCVDVGSLVYIQINRVKGLTGSIDNLNWVNTDRYDFLFRFEHDSGYFDVSSNVFSLSTQKIYDIFNEIKKKWISVTHKQNSIYSTDFFAIDVNSIKMMSKPGYGRLLEISLARSSAFSKGFETVEECLLHYNNIKDMWIACKNLELPCIKEGS